MTAAVTLEDLNPDSPEAKRLRRAPPLVRHRDPTARQVAVLSFIHEYSVSNGSPPTLREIGARLGIRSTNGVVDHLRSLERRGLIVKRDMLSRGLRVTIQGLAVLGVDPATVHDAPPGAPPPPERAISQDLELRAARQENARLRLLLHRVLTASVSDIGQVLGSIRKELGE